MELATRHEFDLTLSSQVTGRGVRVNANAPELLWGLPGGTPGISSSGWVASPSPSQADETGDPTRESPHDRGEKANHPQLYGLSEAFTILGNQEQRRNLKGWDDKVNNNLIGLIGTAGHAI